MALVLISALLIFLGISATFLALLSVLAIFRLLPLHVEASIIELLQDIARYMSAPATSLTLATSAAPITVDSTNWYGRGNVLYQIGRSLQDGDLDKQILRGQLAMNKIERVYGM